jgi:hypothetical protein
MESKDKDASSLQKDCLSCKLIGSGGTFGFGIYLLYTSFKTKTPKSPHAWLLRFMAGGFFCELAKKYKKIGKS